LHTGILLKKRDRCGTATVNQLTVEPHSLLQEQPFQFACKDELRSVIVAVCNCLITEDSCRLAFRIHDQKQFIQLTTDCTQRKDQRELSLYGKDSSLWSK